MTRGGLPNRKVALGGASGAFVTVVAWLMAEVWGIEMPASVAAALTTVVVFVTSYFVSEPPRALDRDH